MFANIRCIPDKHPLTLYYFFGGGGVTLHGVATLACRHCRQTAIASYRHDAAGGAAASVVAGVMPKHSFTALRIACASRPSSFNIDNIAFT